MGEQAIATFIAEFLLERKMLTMDAYSDEDEDEAEGSVWSGEGGIFLRVTGWRTARTRSSTSKKKWSMRPWM